MDWKQYVVAGQTAVIEVGLQAIKPELDPILQLARSEQEAFVQVEVVGTDAWGTVGSSADHLYLVDT